MSNMRQFAQEHKLSIVILKVISKHLPQRCLNYLNAELLYINIYIRNVF